MHLHPRLEKPPAPQSAGRPHLGGSGLSLGTAGLPLQLTLHLGRPMHPYPHQDRFGYQLEQHPGRPCPRPRQYPQVGSRLGWPWQAPRLSSPTISHQKETFTYTL